MLPSLLRFLHQCCRHIAFGRSFGIFGFFLEFLEFFGRVQFSIQQVRSAGSQKLATTSSRTQLQVSENMHMPNEVPESPTR